MDFEKAVTDLVDHNAIQEAKASHLASLRAYDAAEAQLTDAVAAQRSAVSNSNEAVAMGDFSKVTAAELALEKAERSVRVATKLRDGAVAKRDAAFKAIDTATGRAHWGLLAAGVIARVAACKRADAALAELLAADADYRSACQALSHARGNGAGFSPELNGSGRLLNDDGRPRTTAEREMHSWRAHGIDPETGRANYM